MEAKFGDEGRYRSPDRSAVMPRPHRDRKKRSLVSSVSSALDFAFRLRSKINSMSSPDILGEPRPAQEKKDFPWPIAIGAGIVLVVIGVAAALMYKPAPQPGTGRPTPPYAANLQLRDIKMATANNFMGGSVTYLEGSIANTGNQTVTGVTVEATFQNSMNQVVQQEYLPVMVTQERPGYSDNVDLSHAPLAPGKSSPIRITLEHVSSDWNGAYPAVRIVDVKTQ
jgi:hypothetical protein